MPLLARRGVAVSGSASRRATGRVRAFRETRSRGGWRTTALFMAIKSARSARERRCMERRAGTGTSPCGSRPRWRAARTRLARRDRGGEGHPVLLLLAVGSPARGGCAARASGSSGTCPSSPRPTAPMSGPTGSCSSWMHDGQTDRRYPACRRTISRPRASSGATPCTTGTHWRGRGSGSGSGGSGRPAGCSTWCASITSAASRPAGPCPAGERDRGARPMGEGARACSSSRQWRRSWGPLPIIAEDLGVITPEVDALREQLRLPGHEDPAVRLRQRERRADSARTTGSSPTTTRGTRSSTRELTTTTRHGDGGRRRTQEERDFLESYCASTDPEIEWRLIRMAMASVCRSAIVPLQDVLGLGREARMKRRAHPAGKTGPGGPRSRCFPESGAAPAVSFRRSTAGSRS